MPALLEMLGIPYTGAGPAALGMCFGVRDALALLDAVPVPAAGPAARLRARRAA